MSTAFTLSSSPINMSLSGLVRLSGMDLASFRGELSYILRAETAQQVAKVSGKFKMQQNGLLAKQSYFISLRVINIIMPLKPGKITMSTCSTRIFGTDLLLAADGGAGGAALQDHGVQLAAGVGV